MSKNNGKNLSVIDIEEISFGKKVNQTKFHSSRGEKKY